MATRATGKRNKRWMGQVQKNGDRRTAYFRTKREALEWEAKQRAANWSITPYAPTLGKWAELYLSHVRKINVRRVIREKEFAFERLFRSVDKDCLVEDFGRMQAQRFLDSEFGQRTACAVNKTKVHLCAAWNWGVYYLEFPEPNPFAKIKPFPEDKKAQYTPPMKDFWAVYNVASSQHQAMLLLYLMTAARKTEIFSLRWRDVDFRAKEITLYTRKTKSKGLEPKTIPMTEACYNVLLEIHKGQQGAELVFICPVTGGQYSRNTRWLNKLCERAGVKRFGFHGIRRLSATYLAENGVPMVFVSRLLRHSTVSMTERYVNSTCNFRDSILCLDQAFKSGAV